MNIVTIDPKELAEQKADMIAMLDTLRKQIDSGLVTRIGIVTDRVGGGYSTEFSRTGDCRSDAAMLFELAIRRLGFSFKSEP